MAHTSADPRQRESRLQILTRKVWRRVALRNLSGSDNHTQLDRLYVVADPWQMTAPREQYRFATTNALLQEKLGRVETMLEVGCGEGHQSEHLARLCDRLYGVDVSPRAIERAKTRVTAAHFDVGSLPGVPRT